MPYEHCGEDGGRTLIVTREPVVALQLLTGWAIDNELALARLSVSQPTLEDIYLELTGTTAAQPELKEAIA